MTTIHQAVRTETEPGQPVTYRAFCGYKSTNAKEYRGVAKPLEAITCDECYKRLTVKGYRCNGGMKP